MVERFIDAHLSERGQTAIVKLYEATRDYHSTDVGDAKLLILQRSWCLRIALAKIMIPSMQNMNRSCYVR